MKITFISRRTIVVLIAFVISIFAISQIIAQSPDTAMDYKKIPVVTIGGNGTNSKTIEQQGIELVANQLLTLANNKQSNSDSIIGIIIAGLLAALVYFVKNSFKTESVAITELKETSKQILGLFKNIENVVSDIKSITTEHNRNNESDMRALRKEINDLTDEMNSIKKQIKSI
jgi:hypothetical protein